MYEVIYWGNMPLHWPLAALCAVICTGLYAFTTRKNGLCRAALLHVCGGVLVRHLPGCDGQL